jgi:uncharacterized membrane protein YjjP (DUF1212 family)
MTLGALPHPTLPAAGPESDPSTLVLTLAQTLLNNGEDTTATVDAARQLSSQLGLQGEVTPSWDFLVLRINGDQARLMGAAPYGINMNRVGQTLTALQAALAGRLQGAQLGQALTQAAQAPPAPLVLFTLACAVGAGALAIINGATHPGALALIVVSAGVGAVLRRMMGQWGASPLAQVLAASFLAGLLGAAAVRWGVSSQMRLAALGPLMVLVPGPALLNAAIDLAALRLSLGGARLGYGLLTLLLISTGALFGLSLGGSGLPAAPVGHPVALWPDVLCAGLAAACYGVFYSLPLRLLFLPVLVGMLAHGLRWILLSQLHVSLTAATGLACLLVGVILVPLAARLQLPFAAVGFASVVSMVPGIFLFRMGGGLLQLQQEGAQAPLPLVASLLADGTTALTILLAMALGLLVPMRLYARFLVLRAAT